MARKSILIPYVNGCILGYNFYPGDTSIGMHVKIVPQTVLAPYTTDERRALYDFSPPIPCAIDWKPAAPFYARLLFESVGWWYKALRDVDGHIFRVKDNDIWDIIRTCAITDGIVEGWWMPCRYGTRYSLRKATEKDLKHAGITL